MRHQSEDLQTDPFKKIKSDLRGQIGLQDETDPYLQQLKSVYSATTQLQKAHFSSTSKSKKDLLAGPAVAYLQNLPAQKGKRNAKSFRSLDDRQK